MFVPPLQTLGQQWPRIDSASRVSWEAVTDVLTYHTSYNKWQTFQIYHHCGRVYQIKDEESRFEFQNEIIAYFRHSWMRGASDISSLSMIYIEIRPVTTLLKKGGGETCECTVQKFQSKKITMSKRIISSKPTIDHRVLFVAFCWTLCFQRRHIFGLNSAKTGRLQWGFSVDKCSVINCEYTVFQTV